MSFHIGIKRIQTSIQRARSLRVMSFHIGIKQKNINLVL